MKYELRKGFTLIELLVVIAIIAILSTVGLTAFTNAQQRGRDAKRQGDIKDMKNAFEQYYASNNSLYGATCATMAISYLQGGSMPLDPKSPAQSYTCSGTALGTTYCACAFLETPGKGNATGLGTCGTGGTPAWGVPLPAVRGYQCVVNAQ